MKNIISVQESENITYLWKYRFSSRAIANMLKLNYEIVVTFTRMLKITNKPYSYEQICVNLFDIRDSNSPIDIRDSNSPIDINEFKSKRPKKPTGQ